MKRIIVFLIGLFFLLTGISAANVMHLVTGTIRYSGGNIPDSITFQAYITSRSGEVLTQNSSGCGYEDGYYWIQCGNFPSEWHAGDVLHIDVSDLNGFSSEGEVALTYAASDPLNIVIEIITYGITIGTNPEGLEFTVDDTVYSATRTFTWLEDSQHEISVSSPQSITADVRYDFSDWSDGQPQIHTIVADMDKSVTAHFIAKYRLTTHIDPASSGSIELVPAGQFYSSGTIVTLNAEPDTENGYLFDRWSGDLSGDTNPDTLHIASTPKSVTAHFVLRTHSLLVNVSPPGAGNVTINPEKTEYNFGETVQLEAIPDTDFVFQSWSGDVSSTSSIVSVTMDHDQSITANFRKKGVLPPQLVRCYPPDGSVYIPKNTDIQMVIAGDSYGDGLNLHSLNLTVNDTLVVQNGVVQPGKEVEIQNRDYSVKISYNPLFNFPNYKEVVVRAECQDLLSSTLFVDSTYAFTTGPSEAVVTKSQAVDMQGGDVNDFVLNVLIDIPEDALVDTTEILCGFLAISIPLPDTLDRMSLIYYFGPDGIQFSDSVILAIPYTQGDLTQIGAESPDKIPVYYFSTVEGAWQRIPVAYYDTEHFYVKVEEFCFLVFGKISTSEVVYRDVNRSQFPQQFKLFQNYPNPFNPQTNIRFQIPKVSFVIIEIYNSLGQRVKTLLEENVEAGLHEVSWDGTSHDGVIVNSGIYYTVMKVKNQIFRQKVILIR
jgi:hypothetical protein